MKRMQKRYFPTQCMAAETDASISTSEKKRFRLRPITIASCALLLALLFGVAFHAVGLGMWRLIVTWDDETMKMWIDTQGRIVGQDYENDFDPVCEDAFFLKLKDMDMDLLLPSRLPDGFVLELVESKIETEYLRWVAGIYTCGERDFKISIVKNTSKNPGGIWNLEKDEREPDIIELGGIRFYIMDNLSRSRVFWIDLPYIIDITGHVTREEIMHVIDSIFDRSI